MPEKIYNIMLDLDFMDYTETRESDLDYIAELLKDYTIDEVLEILSR